MPSFNSSPSTDFRSAESFSAALGRRLTAISCPDPDRLRDLLQQIEVPAGCLIALAGPLSSHLLAVVGSSFLKKIPFVVLRSRTADSAAQEAAEIGARKLVLAFNDTIDVVEFKDAVDLNLPPLTAYLVSSSGTTGQPKYSVIGLEAYYRVYRKVCCWLDEEKVELTHYLVTCEPSFGYFFWDIFVGCLIAKECTIDGPMNRPPHRTYGRKVSFSTTPTKLMLGYHCVDREPLDQGVIFLSGEATLSVHREAIDKLLSQGATIFSSYAMTETAGQLAMRRLTKSSDLTSGCCGLPLPGVVVEIDAITSQVIVTCDTLLSGSLVDGRYIARTGPTLTTADIGYIAASGHLYITGRKLSSLRRFGRTIDVGYVRDQIENSIGASIVDVCSFGEQSILAVTVYGDRKILSEDELLLTQDCDFIFYAEKPTLTTTGKLESFARRFFRLCSSCSNPDDVRAHVLCILKALNRNQIEGNLENYVELTSLETIRLSEGLSVAFQLPIPAQALFACADLSSIVDLVMEVGKLNNGW